MLALLLMLGRVLAWLWHWLHPRAQAGSFSLALLRTTFALAWLGGHLLGGNFILP